MTKELVAVVGKAKSSIDTGFSQVGKSLKSGDEVAKALMILAARAVAKANALALLAEHSHANEALPILRSLLETAVQMRWISAKDSARRAGDVLGEREKATWQEIWDDARVKVRAQELGFWDERLSRVLSSCREHLHANAAGLPWGHLYAEKDGGVPPDEVLRATAALMGHAVKALDETWPGKFPGAEEMWRRV
jgi:hypothetical protein